MQEVWSLPAADAERGLRALWWCAGPAGELAVMLVHERYLEHVPYIKGWLGWVPKGSFAGELVTVTTQGERRTTLEDVRIHPSYLALLPDSRFLLVDGRTSQSAPGGDWMPNALVFSASGAPEGEFCIGDDIATLITDRHGGIWTAYGDEGIYGGHPESGAGLAGWDSEGHVTWAPGGRLPDYPLEGCTAATEDDQVWLVWYSGGGRKAGTYLTRITPSTGEARSYRSPVRDPDGFAVRGNRAVLTRRHHNQRTVELTRAAFDGSRWKAIDRRTLGVPGPVVMRCGQSRDGVLWLRGGDTWLRIEV